MPEMFVRDEGEDVHAKCCTISFGDFLRMVTGRWQVHKAFWRRIWCLDQKKKKFETSGFENSRASNL